MSKFFGGFFCFAENPVTTPTPLDPYKYKPEASAGIQMLIWRQKEGPDQRQC